jgi:hypothetical protein
MTPRARPLSENGKVIELAKVLQAIATEPINWNTTDLHYYAGIAGKFQLLADAALGTVHEISMKTPAPAPSPQGRAMDNLIDDLRAERRRIIRGEADNDTIEVFDRAMEALERYRAALEIIANKVDENKTVALAALREGE